MTPCRGKTLFSYFPSTNSLVSVSDPRKAIWADKAPFKGSWLAICVASKTTKNQRNFNVWATRSQDIVQNNWHKLDCAFSLNQTLSQMRISKFLPFFSPTDWQNGLRDWRVDRHFHPPFGWDGKSRGWGGWGIRSGSRTCRSGARAQGKKVSQTNLKWIHVKGIRWPIFMPIRINAWISFMFNLRICSSISSCPQFKV